MNSVVLCKLNRCKPRRWRGKLISKRRLEGDQVGNQIGKWKEGEGWLGFRMGHVMWSWPSFVHFCKSNIQANHLHFLLIQHAKVVRQRRQWISVIDFIFFCSFCSSCFCSVASYTIQITTLVVRKQSGKKGLYGHCLVVLVIADVFKGEQEKCTRFVVIISLFSYRSKHGGMNSQM